MCLLRGLGSTKPVNSIHAAHARYLPMLLQASDSMRSVPSLGNICPQYEIGGPVDHGKSLLIAAIYMGRNDIIAELLACRANPLILSHIK